MSNHRPSGVTRGHHGVCERRSRHGGVCSILKERSHYSDIAKLFEQLNDVLGFMSATFVLSVVTPGQELWGNQWMGDTWSRHRCSDWVGLNNLTWQSVIQDATLGPGCYRDLLENMQIYFLHWRSYLPEKQYGLLSFVLCKDNDLPFLHSQYDGYWWPGDSWSQCISMHCIWTNQTVSLLFKSRLLCPQAISMHFHWFTFLMIFDCMQSVHSYFKDISFHLLSFPNIEAVHVSLIFPQ